jgi:hypothetical protein
LSWSLEGKKIDVAGAAVATSTDQANQWDEDKKASRAFPCRYEG